MSLLHYLVKLEMLIGHVLPLSCYRKKLQNLSHLNCVLQIRQIWIQLITVCEHYCKRRCTKHVSLTWTNWNSDWEQSGPIRLRPGLCRYSSVASLIAPEQWWVFCTPFLATFPTCCYQLYLNLANLEATV